MPKSGNPVSLLKRFLSKITVPDDPEACWIWKASVDKDGYGACRFDGKIHQAHRLSYEMFIGPIPEGMVLLHKCDTPVCVNPEHTRPGTQAENLQDMRDKGRAGWQKK